MNVLKIELKYEKKGETLFSPQKKELWNNIRKEAVGKGAYQLKMKIRKQLESELPAAANPLRSINPYTKKRWKGRLIDLPNQGKVDVYDDRTETDVFLKDRRSGYGSWIAIIYNKGNFLSPDRQGKKKGAFKPNKQTNKFYHKRGNIRALDYFEKGQQGFEFSTTVNELLKRYINEIK